MNIKLSFVGYLEFKDVKSGDLVELKEGTTVTELLTAQGVSHTHQRHIIPIVNGEEEKLSCVLHDGDELTLFLPVGGG